MIEAKRLSYFVQIAQDGSLSKASESLQIAQPALSRQLQLLEEYLGFQLFVRTGRGMQITREGELLLNAVSGPLREIELSVENMRSFLSRVEMSISVGIYQEMAKVMAEPLLAAVEKELPNVKLRLLEAPSDVLIEWIKQGSIDFGVIDYPSPDESLKDRLIAMEDLVLLGEPSMVAKWVDSLSALDIHALAELPLIVPCSHQGVRKVLETAANIVRLPLNIAFEIDTHYLMVSLAVQKRGFLILPRTMADWVAEMRPLIKREINGPNLKLGTYLSNRHFVDVESSVVTRTDRIIQKIILDIIEPLTV